MKSNKPYQPTRKISALLSFLMVAAMSGAIASQHIGQYRGSSSGSPIYHPKRKKFKPGRYAHGKR